MTANHFSNLPPLPERLRPHCLSDYVGQSHLVGEGCVLRNMIESGNVSSFILWGPPGVGKTTLARIVAGSLDRQFFTLSAVSSGVKDVRDVIDTAKKGNIFSSGAAPILFIDEIHRFNKAQQDALLGAVEAGTVILIGATTENPSFEVITPLLSRMQVFVLKPLDSVCLDTLLGRALKEDVVLKNLNIEISEKEALFRYSGGDGRKLLNLLELVISHFPEEAETIIIENKVVSECLQANLSVYDKDGEMHYDLISAFIKSVRGSDPNAAVYYLARMLDGGEDPLFIARRLCISAAEDIGLANPNALLLAGSTFQIVNQIGMPEARIPLSECAIYLASSPKSNSAYLAIDSALDKVRNDSLPRPVPLPLRNAPTKLMEELGYADGYKYSHDYPGHFAEQEFLPEGLEGTSFYNPQENKHENVLASYLKDCWKDKYSK